MLKERHLKRYADVLIWGLKTARKKAFLKGDIILIKYHIPSVRLAEILEEKILRLGLNPVQQLIPTPEMEKNFFQIATNKQLEFHPPGTEELYQHLNGAIFLFAPDSLTHLSNIDPRKINRFAIARKPLHDIMDAREEAGLFSWTLCVLPTQIQADHSGLSLESYTRQIINACYLNRRSPVEEWRKIYKMAITVKKWLNAMQVNKFHIESRNIDLIVTPGAHRRWKGVSGHNIPSFELFISPDWRGTSGVYYADQPSYRNGNYIEGVKLLFDKGTVVKAEAAKGQKFFREQIAMDMGANRMGEFSLTDKKFSRINHFMANTLFDENYGGNHGNCHIALGSSYADTYDGDTGKLTPEKKAKLGFNDSALHWDLINTEKKTVTAHLGGGKRKIIYENGEFTC